MINAKIVSRDERIGEKTKNIKYDATNENIVLRVTIPIRIIKE